MNDNVRNNVLDFMNEIDVFVSDEESKTASQQDGKVSSVQDDKSARIQDSSVPRIEEIKSSRSKESKTNQRRSSSKISRPKAGRIRTGADGDSFEPCNFMVRSRYHLILALHAAATGSSIYAILDEILGEELKRKGLLRRYSSILESQIARSGFPRGDHDEETTLDATEQ